MATTFNSKALNKVLSKDSSVKSYEDINKALNMVMENGRIMDDKIVEKTSDGHQFVHGHIVIEIYTDAGECFDAYCYYLYEKDETENVKLFRLACGFELLCDMRAE